LPGNDDCGAISSWLIFSALGFYPACPSSKDYKLGNPLFDKATIYLNEKYFPGKEFVIEKKTGSPKIEFNSRSINELNIQHNSIVEGGKLYFWEK
jgi:putative alpha-1,2-mannosidase